MSEPKWTHNIDPELGDFYDASIGIDGKEVLALVVMKKPEGWEGCIESHGNELQVVTIAQGSPEDAMRRVAVEARGMLEKMLLQCRMLYFANVATPEHAWRFSR